MLQALVLAAAATAAAPVPQAPTRWVTDNAAFLSEGTRATLDARLEGYERATGHQVIVWIGKTIGDTPLDDWAVRTFAAWKVGQKGKDDGLVMFVLADDRKVDIEVGYGLEDKVPDAIASRVIRDVMTPKLRANDRDGAVTAGVDAILTAIEGHPWNGGAATAPIATPVRTNVPGSPLTWVLGALAIIGFVIFAITHPRMAMFMLWTFMANGRGGGFGGFGGGGGGGFGGGGGRSGGGGARGGW